jgi:hypothetical protein
MTGPGPAVRATYVQREQHRHENGRWEASAVLEGPSLPRRRLWFQVGLPAGWRLTESSDPFLPIPLFTAMRRGGPLRVEGEISPSLLANLEEFQAVYTRWHPGRFRRVEIMPAQEREQPVGEEGALVPFSGGVDSAFTVFRHATGRAGRQEQTLRAAFMVHGFDIPLDEPDGFAAAASKAEATLETLGLPLLHMASNLWEIEHAWDTVVGAAIGSCLMLLQPNARVGLIPASVPYDIRIELGPNPLTDPLLSSSALRIVHDGAGFTRPQKIEEIARWPAAIENLRVCWAGEVRDGNCGHCKKCIATILAFRAAGLPFPECFPSDVTDAQLRKLGRAHPLASWDPPQILEAASARGIAERWVKVTAGLQRRSRRKYYRALLADYLRRRARAVISRP